MIISEQGFFISVRGDEEKVRVIKIALNYVPEFVVNDLRDHLAILTMTHRPGLRLSRPLCETCEVVLLSEERFPRVGGQQHESDFRFFIYLVLHELAHTYLKHKCPYFDKLSPEEITKNEDDATAKAIEWFNLHIFEKQQLGQKTMNDIEIKSFELNC